MPVWPSLEFCGLSKIPFDKSLRMFVKCGKKKSLPDGFFFSGRSFLMPVSVPLHTVIKCTHLKTADK